MFQQWWSWITLKPEMIFLVLFTTVFQVNRILGGHTTRRQGSCPRGSHTTPRCPDPGLAVTLNSVLTPRKQSFEQKNLAGFPLPAEWSQTPPLGLHGIPGSLIQVQFPSIPSSLPSRQSKETIIFYTHRFFHISILIFTLCLPFQIFILISSFKAHLKYNFLHTYTRFSQLFLCVTVNFLCKLV